MSTPHREEVARLLALPHSKRLEQLRNKPCRRTLKSLDNHSSGVYLLSKGIVKKMLPRNPQGYVLWKNEVNALKRVQGDPHFPLVLAVDTTFQTIYMNYCGKTLEEMPPLPPKWRQQIKQVKRSLFRHRLNPNDILPRNVCVRNGQIVLIDFGLSNTQSNAIEKSIHKLEKLFTDYEFRLRNNRYG